MAVTTSALKTQEKKVDGGLATVEDKKIPDRQALVAPLSLLSACNMFAHYAARQLCVSACLNQVLHPSTKLMSPIQPGMSYERSYCRPECNDCSQVCPTGVIRPITMADKSSAQIGHAIWVRINHVPLTGGVECDNCARHYSTGAIRMILSIPDQPDSPKIPAASIERYIDCGACENLCLTRLFNAIHVEDRERHRIT